jgi:hypothetical protein
MKNRVFLLVLSLCLLASPALAQLGVSTINGRVTDASGAVVPGAAVNVVNTATNFTYTSETNSEGLFRVPSLQPGPYRVEVEASGFKRFVRDNLDVRAGVTVPVNAALEVGVVTEQVEVTAETALLETETSAMGASVTGEIMYKLPNYQRYPASTLNFVSGITTGGYAYGGGLGSYHVAGQRNSALGAFDDGVSTNSQSSGTDYVRPVLNAVEEIKVFSTALPAEYGHSAGGVMDCRQEDGHEPVSRPCGGVRPHSTHAAPPVVRPVPHVGLAARPAQRFGQHLLPAGLQPVRSRDSQQDLLLCRLPAPD